MISHTFTNFYTGNTIPIFGGMCLSSLHVSWGSRGSFVRVSLRSISHKTSSAFVTCHRIWSIKCGSFWTRLGLRLRCFTDSSCTRGISFDFKSVEKIGETILRRWWFFLNFFDIIGGINSLAAGVIWISRHNDRWNSLGDFDRGSLVGRSMPGSAVLFIATGKGKQTIVYK